MYAGRNRNFVIIINMSDKYVVQGTLNGNGNYSPYSNGHSYVSARPNSPQGPSLDEMSLSMSPPATPEAKNTVLKPRGLEQRARMNVG